MMNWLLKNNILPKLDETQIERSKLKNHLLYHSIKTEEHLHIFMENHVFAVWDFMSILKTLQSKLTCVTVPWIPKANGNLSRLINEIVLAEESDVDRYGQHLSHFEMYYIAMKEAGASTTSIDNFLTQLKTSNVFTALESSKAHQAAIDFVTKTFKTLETLANTKIAIDWLRRGIPTFFQKNLAAVSSAPDEALHYGIGQDRVFSFPDGVGGRYSIWGPIGLPLMIAIGKENLSLIHI